MSQKIIQFRSKTQREKEVDLIAKYREIGIAAIAGANQSLRKQSETVKTQRAKGYQD